MTIYCLTPFHRIGVYPNAIYNFDRQTYKDKFLVLVLNGQVVEVNINLGFDCAIIKSDPGVSNARNASLDYIRGRFKPGDIACHMDSDDWYGPDYLTELVACYEPGKLHSRSEVLIRTKTLGLFKQQLSWHGATFAYDRLIDFPRVDQYGEDRLVLEMYPHDQRVVVPYSNEYIYNRADNGRGNTWPATDWQIKHMIDSEVDSPI